MTIATEAPPIPDVAELLRMAEAQESEPNGLPAPTWLWRVSVSSAAPGVPKPGDPEDRMHLRAGGMVALERYALALRSEVRALRSRLAEMEVSDG